MLDVRRLRLLRELARRGTIAAVAEAMSYSPSAVSQQLSTLEVEAGVTLLERAGRGVRLTSHAEVLVAHAETVLEGLERAEADLASMSTSLAGTLRVAAFQSAVLRLVPPVLNELRAAYPDLRVEVTEAEPEVSLPALIARDFDLVLSEEYPGHPQVRRREVQRRPLVSDELRLVLPTSWKPTRLARLASRPWVMEPVGTTAREWTTAVCRASGFEPDVRFTSTDLLIHLRLIETGHAAGLLPDFAGAQDRRSVMTHRLRERPSRQVFTCVRRGAVGHPAVRAFEAAALRATAQRGRR